MNNLKFTVCAYKTIYIENFDINKNKLNIIIGPNGSGKSNILNAINYFQNPEKSEDVKTIYKNNNIYDENTVTLVSSEESTSLLENDEIHSIIKEIEDLGFVLKNKSKYNHFSRVSISSNHILK